MHARVRRCTWRMNTVPRVFAYLRRYPWLAFGMLSCAVVGTAMVLMFPAVTKRVIDEVLTRRIRSG